MSSQTKYDKTKPTHGSSNGLELMQEHNIFRIRLKQRSRTLVEMTLGLCLMLFLLAMESRAAYPPTQSVRLVDGRILEYAEYGSPTGPVVLYFHGTPGSHLEPYAVIGEIFDSGLHIIAVNRPGIGTSTYQCGRRILDWPADVSALIAALGYEQERFGIIAFSGGTPYALACAHAYPQRIEQISIISGHVPLGTPGVVSGNEDRLIQIFRCRPRLATIAVGVTTRRLLRNPDFVVKRVIKRWDSADRALILCNPNMRQLLESSLQQTTRCGTQGIVADVQLLGGCWGFPVREAGATPISIWHGRCDRIAPISMGMYFHAELPGSELHVDTCAGHVTMFKWHAAEILAEHHLP